MSEPQHSTADAIRVSSHSYGRSAAPLTISCSGDTPLRIGQIVTLAESTDAAPAVVTRLHGTPVEGSTPAVVTPYALTATQLDLARWIANHYVTSLGNALSLFVSKTMFPAPLSTWQATSAGQTAVLGELPVAERGILFQLRRHGTHTNDQLLAATNTTPKKLLMVLEQLRARGYVDRHTTAAAIPQRRARVTAFTLDSARADAEAAWIARSAHRNALVTAVRSDTVLPPNSPGLATARRDLLARGVLLPRAQPVLPAPSHPVALTDAQQAAYATILAALHAPRHEAFLLQGVTGSGKTEVYFALIDACIAARRQILVLVPEIALTTQLAQRFETRFPGRVALIHGQIPLVARHAAWQDAASGEKAIFLGPRSALSVPIPALGLVIVDEEHDASYKSERTPLIHARDAAIMYARFANVPVVLGSATPSVELMHAANAQRVTRLELPDRVGADGSALQRPPVRVIDMRVEATVDRAGQISTLLDERIRATLAAPAQVMLLLNRRGSTGSRLCTHCGTVETCPRCSTPLVSHGGTGQRMSLCHTCGYWQHAAHHCRECFHTAFLEYGSGTQRVVEWLRTAYPGVPVFQWDRDTADSARAHAALLAEISQHDAAVIVGTQMIAKGLDLPKIRLVGVVNTDLGLHLPDFRAAERTYQLLVQVAGRAGRRAGEASVVFQSFTPDNYAIQAAARYDAAGFYHAELAYREYLQYPPFSRMAKLVWQHRDAESCRTLAEQECAAITETLTAAVPDVRVVGPAPAFFSKIRDQYHWQALLVGQQVRTALHRIATQHRATIDVDPVSIL